MPRRIYPNLIAYFHESGETMKDAAHALGISLPYMSLMVAGLRQPTLDLALEIQKHCGVPLESLVSKTRRASRAS